MITSGALCLSASSRSETLTILQYVNPLSLYIHIHTHIPNMHMCPEQFTVTVDLISTNRNNSGT
jgi:hypothetical protein